MISTTMVGLNPMSTVTTVYSARPIRNTARRSSTSATWPAGMISIVFITEYAISITVAATALA